LIVDAKLAISGENLIPQLGKSVTEVSIVDALEDVRRSAILLLGVYQGSATARVLTATGPLEYSIDHRLVHPNT